MVDIKYKMNWVPQAKELRDRLTAKENVGIASKIDEDTDNDFYQDMYEALSTYFSDDDEANKVLIPEEVDRDGVTSEVLKSYDDIMRYYGKTGMLSREAVDVEVDKILGDPRLLEIPTKTFDDTEEILSKEEALSVEEVSDIASDAIDAVEEETTNAQDISDTNDADGGAASGKDLDFYLDIGKYAEGDHGDIPKPTNDSREADKPIENRSKDVGYGHKVKDFEETSGLIHGIKFKREDGSYIPLTEKQKIKILNADMARELKLAREGGWDKKLKVLGTKWEDLDSKYKNALNSLAYNVGGPKAAKQWTAVLFAAKDKNVLDFAAEMRRKDNKKYTAGMDNRVVKELYYAGIINNFSEVSSVLPLATADGAGVPE